MPDVTRILTEIEQGDASAADQLLPLVYSELRKLAAAKLAHEKPGQTLQATALVHEAYIRLVDQTTTQEWDNSRHFFAAAAEAMRRILVEKARQRRRVKHGGQFQRVALEESRIVAGSSRDDDILAVDEGLEKLAEVDEQAANLVKLRYFSGLPLEQAANILGISVRTAYRNWAFARAWLFRFLAE